jgi:hypothetical protein
MLKNDLKSYVLFLVLFVFIVGCGKPVSEKSFQHSSGISFDFPDGWSPLSNKEWRDMDLGKDRTIITIMDKNREASFSIIPVRLGSTSRITFNKPSGGASIEATFYVNSIHAAGPNKYEDYSLFRKGETTFADFPMGEIVFQGQNPGKELRWYRILVLAGADSNKSVLMLVFSTPMDEQSEFENDFDFIENSWNWDN